MAQKQRIQNALVDAARATPSLFRRVSYDANQKLTVTATAVAPTGVQCNEVESTWGAPARNHMTDMRERVEWTWELRIEFPEEVSLELFEASFPIKLARTRNADGTTADPQVTLELSRAAPVHPTTKGPRTGTKVTYVVSARQAPR